MPAIDLDNLPSYAQLSAREDAPKGSAWGLFGPDDQLGTVNFLTPPRVPAAARRGPKGPVSPPTPPLHLPDPPLFNRGRYRHQIRRFEQGLGAPDHPDYLYLHASSQWDNLAHPCHPP